MEVCHSDSLMYLFLTLTLTLETSTATTAGGVFAVCRTLLFSLAGSDGNFRSFLLRQTQM